MENYSPRNGRPGLNADSKPAAAEPAVTTRSFSTPTPKKEEKKSSGWLKWLIIALVALVVVGGGAWFAVRTFGAQNTIDSSKYQAVFLSNGQVYFGKLQMINDSYMKLTNVFYIQSNTSSSTSDSENPQKSSSDTTDMQLIKLGNEVHGPEDEMIIAKDQLLFYENLKSDGKVAKLIDQYKQ